MCIYIHTLVFIYTTPGLMIYYSQALNKVVLLKSKGK